MAHEQDTWESIRKRLSDQGAHDLVAVLAALAWFEARLSHDWPGWAESYPFATQFSLTFGAETRQGVRLHQLASLFDDGAAARDAVRRLGGRDWRDYYCALTELEVAGAVRAAGHTVELIAPKPGTSRSPDFRVRLADRFVDCECTALVDSQPENWANIVFDFLFFYALTNRNLGRSVIVRFERGASARDAHDNLREIERAIIGASADGMRTLLPSLALVEPIGVEGEPATVAIDGGLLVGDATKPLTQLRRSIRAKLNHGQLAPSEPTVLFVRTRAFSLFALNLTAWLESVADLVLECLRDCQSTISAVVVFERWRGSPYANFTVDSQHYFATAGTDREASRFVVLVRNPRAQSPLSAEEMNILIGPRMVW